MAQLHGTCSSRIRLAMVLATAAVVWMPAPARGQTLWHAGNFRKLPSIQAELIPTVAALAHPNAGAYGRLSATREQKFEIFLDGLFTAIDASLADGATGDWCGVQVQATDAGYAVRRFRDDVTGRWFVYGYDTTSFGQAYFFINPFAKRNIVIEVPHEGYDRDTAVEGARIFTELAARALIINKEHRCSHPEPTECSGASTGPCPGIGLTRSDVAHEERNTFHVLHRHLSDRDGVTKFVQLHGFDGTNTDIAEIADGTTTDVNASSVSVLFASKLDTYVPSSGAEAVDSCQEYAGNPPSGLCATTNVQGRYTNGSADECTLGTTSLSNRFLHVEQATTLRDNDPSDGYWWGDVRDALRDTWPACNMNSGGCALGAAQTAYTTLSCP
jgi:hypothetical protein